MKPFFKILVLILMGKVLAHAGDYITIQNKLYISGEAAQVQAGQQISAHTNVLVSSGAVVSYVAGTELFFGPGFSVQEGATFNARIDGSVQTHGIPEQWAMSNGLNPYSANIALDDPDHDGLTNLAEFNLGTNPNVADGRVAFRSLGLFETPIRWVLAPGSAAPTIWRYTTNAPIDLNSWKNSSFVDSTWISGSAGFANYYGVVDGEVDQRRTDWGDATPELWLRNTFIVNDPSDIATLIFWGRIDDTMEVYINGELALEEKAWSPGYRYYGLKEAARAVVRPGVNTIAVHAKDIGGNRYFDLGITTNASLVTTPSSGWEAPGFEIFGEILRQYMKEHGIPGGVIAVMKDDQLLVSRAYGWSDRRLTLPLSNKAIMRLASNDKVITLGALRCLLNSNLASNWKGTGQNITESSRVFMEPNAATFGVLGLVPMPGYSVDPRKYNITIGDLIKHESGIRELPSPETFYQNLGVPYRSLTTMEDNIRWTYSAPFLGTPGVTAYSSIGYATLRYIVQVASGDLSGYLSNFVFYPERSGVFVDIGGDDIVIAHEQLDQRSSREPWYATLDTHSASMEYPNRRLYLENYTALSVTAPAYARYLQYYGIRLGTRLTVLSDGHGSGEGDGVIGFPGRMAGTTSYAWQNIHDRISIVLIFNIDGFYDDVANEMFGPIAKQVFHIE